MTVVLELPPDMESQIAAEATQKRMPLSDYLLTVISRRNMPITEGLEAYLLSESALAKDWLRLEEDEAWQHL